MIIISFLTAAVFTFVSSQLVIPFIAPSNLSGTWDNVDMVNKDTILWIKIDEYDCTISKGMHCPEPETVCIAIAPTIYTGECYYNNHTDSLHILTPEMNYTYGAYFYDDGNVISLMNMQPSSTESCYNTGLLSINETVHLKRRV